MRLSNKAKMAVLIGTLCSVSYFAVYIARNILSAVSPQMVDSGIAESYITTVSAVYFYVYAVGQLINGIIGDKIKARYMISFGLILAGVCNVIYPSLLKYEFGSTVVYGIIGFFLAMIYAPMTKVVAENVEPVYVPRCSMGYEFAALLGSPVAGLLAAILPTYAVFRVGGGILLFMGAVAFVCFLVLELRGIVTYGKYDRKEKGKARIKELFKYNIVKFSFIAIVTGVVRTSVVFLLPMYFQHLDFSAKMSATLFSVVTLIISLTTFIAVFVYERLKSMDKTILLMFSIATVAFFAVWLVKNPYVNIVCLVIAIMGSGSVASMLWCKYCPSLRDTGMVSAVTGFLDFLSYMGAGTANLISGKVVNMIGWSWLVLVWFALMLFGVIISLPYGYIIEKFKKAK
ncbi:MAG: MFS transporter [Ruminococcaceae bacterium]|nr:MFS transporter [Oscillospiraceae bacterium]